MIKTTEIRCSECGCASPPGDTSFCVDCGHAVEHHEEALSVRSGCSECPCTTDPADANFCPDCGHAASSHSPVVTAATGCSECECARHSDLDTDYCPDCGHAASLHSTEDGDGENERTRRRIEEWLGTGQSAAEVARLANDRGLQWDGETRIWEAKNVELFRQTSPSERRSLRAHREARGWTRAELAERAGLGSKVLTVVLAEGGTIGPDDPCWPAFASALGISIDDIERLPTEPAPSTTSYGANPTVPTATNVEAERTDVVTRPVTETWWAAITEGFHRIGSYWWQLAIVSVGAAFAVAIVEAINDVILNRSQEEREAADLLAQRGIESGSSGNLLGIVLGASSHVFIVAVAFYAAIVVVAGLLDRGPGRKPDWLGATLAIGLVGCLAAIVGLVAALLLPEPLNLLVGYVLFAVCGPGPVLVLRRQLSWGRVLLPYSVCFGSSAGRCAWIWIVGLLGHLVVTAMLAFAFVLPIWLIWIARGFLTVPALALIALSLAHAASAVPPSSDRQQ